MTVEPSPTAGLHALLRRQLRRLRLDAGSAPAEDSEWQRLLSRVSAVYDDADRERYTLERSIDVASTEMAELYEQLQRREAAVRAIVDNAAEAILTVEDGLITSFNPAAQHMYGWDDEDVRGRALTELVAGPLWIPVNRADGDSTAVEGVCLRRDGSTFPALASVGVHRQEQRTIATVIVRDISERKDLEARLAYQAGHDSLTGLPNRAHFGKLLQAALAAARANGTEIAVLFSDLNRFKIINDSLGHKAGDDVLITAARRLRMAVRTGDTVARLSGDEFVILCEDVERGAGVNDIAERIHNGFASPLQLGDQRIHLSCSIGIAYGSGLTAGEVLRNADMAMYRAKKSGAGHSAVFDEALHEWASRRLDVENGLRQALQRGELRVHFQPIVRADDLATEHMEALIRWHRPGHGVLGPGEFLEVAAEAGLMPQIDRWVLRLACAQAARWSRPVPVAVNLSPVMFHQAGTAELVAAALAESGLPAHRLAIEIPESLLGNHQPIATETLNAIRALGAEVHLDDFGAQYSSLGRLRDFTIDVLKIDRTFVASIDDPTNRAIVRAVTGLARALGIKTVAEGVEFDDQLRELQEAGCDYVQGYLTGRPLTPEHTERFLAGGLPGPVTADDLTLGQPATA